MPESNEFVPKPKSASRFSTNWFGGGSSSAEDAEKERERSTGKVRMTRRMGREEGEQVPVGMGTRSRDRADPMRDPAD